MFAASKTATVTGATPDAQFNYVTMLLHGDGTNGAQNNTFLDSSTNNFTITRNGNTTQGSFSPYGSNWSTFVGVDNNLLSVPSNAAFAFGTGDFTVEGWFFQTADSTYPSAMEIGDHGSSTGILFITGNAGNAKIYSGGFFGSAAITLNAWNHIAWVRSSGVLQIYVNGVGGTSATFTNNLTNTATVTISNKSPFASDYKFNGYISNLRVVKGTAVYTSNFTPSKTPLTAISGTSLLTCQSNRFIDNSSNAFAITVTGTPSIQRFNPFGTSTAYSTSVIGGSGYFDGAGDSLIVGNPSVNSQLALGSNDFTIQAWVYPQGTGIYTILGSLNNSNGNGSYWLMVNGTFSGGGIIQFGYNYVSGGSGGNDVLFGTGTLPVNAWSFVAVTRSGSNLRGYVNGVQIGTTNTSIGSRTIYPTNQALYVGRNVDSDAYAMNGYLSDVQLVNGTALYTGTTMTVPTAPLTAITNTALLCNMTNGAIYDNAMMNNLETVGNAQISTSVVKYGTGSMSFDGTDDRLTTASSPNIAFGTGDFTVEAWIYTNVLAGELGFLQTSDTVGGLKTSFTTGLFFNIAASPYRLNVNVGNTDVNSGTTFLAINTWYHVAVTRSSGSVRLFINGTLVGGPTTITANLTGQNIVVGGYYNTSFLWNGYIDDLRVTKGFARYTANFTPPTAAFPNTGPV
jgi:hypothetical protein